MSYIVMLTVIKPGMQTTVQDIGRWGHQSSGVSVAGAMDLTAHSIANHLVGNKPSAATLEITLIGPELEFEDERVLAVCGADFDLSIGSRAVSMDSTFRVLAGDRLKFGARSAGARAYLAVSGGIDVPQVLGSRSTHLPSGMGGYDGRALKAGDRVPLGRAPALASNGAMVTAERPWPDGPTVLRVMAGPQDDRFSAEAFEAMCASEYRIGNESNRMGFRLEGPRLVHPGGADMLSDATPIGALQVPPSGQPLLLMADRPATGGYPKIATVITADMPLAAQLAPGDIVGFAACSLEEALEALDDEERELAEGAPWE